MGRMPGLLAPHLGKACGFGDGFSAIPVTALVATPLSERRATAPKQEALQDESQRHSRIDHRNPA
jgi:hypothetical protein